MDLRGSISPLVTAARGRLRRVVTKDPVTEQVRERIEEEHEREQTMRYGVGQSGRSSLA